MSIVDDKLLTELYQKRKQQIQAPEIVLNQTKIKSRKLSTLAGLFGLAGIASFSIFALVSYWVKPVDSPNIEPVTQHHQVTVKVLPARKDNQLIAVPPLPAKPSSQLPNKPLELSAQATAISQLQAELVKTPKFEGKVQLPDIESPNVERRLIHRVMPEYDRKALLSKWQGQVQLSYKVNADGSIGDIKVIEADVRKPLIQSAKRALKQWRYQPIPLGQQVEEVPQQVIFTFSLNQ